MDLNAVLNGLLPAFNILSLLVFVILLTLAGIRMLVRFGNFLIYRVSVPVLLKRDIALFLALATYFGTALISLTFGWNVFLSHQWWWVMTRGIMVLSAMTYWVWVEYNLENE